MGRRIGVDIGGTFTDVALIDEESGSIGIAKVPTTTQDITEGGGVREVQQKAVRLMVMVCG